MTKQEFSEKVTELIDRTKSGDPILLDRQTRIEIIEELIEDYVIESDGKVPDSYELERLGSLILREELSDTNPHKTKHDTDPFLSNEQYVRRTEGRHRKKDVNGRQEIGFKSTITIGVDGKDYRMPIRKTN